MPRTACLPGSLMFSRHPRVFVFTVDKHKINMRTHTTADMETGAYDRKGVGALQEEKGGSN